MRWIAARVSGPISPSTLGADGLLQKADGRADAVIDRRIEMHERQRRRQLRAARRLASSGEIDVAHGLRIDALQLRLEPRRVRRIEPLALPGRELGEDDAEVGRPAGIVRIFGVAALHLEHMLERALESVRIACDGVPCAGPSATLSLGHLSPSSRAFGNAASRSRHRADCRRAA